jgi:hypothetical protein
MAMVNIFIFLLIPALVLAELQSTSSLISQSTELSGRHKKQQPAAGSDLLSIIIPTIIKLIVAPFQSFFRAMARVFLLVIVLLYFLSGFIPILFGLSSKLVSSPQKRLVIDNIESIAQQILKMFNGWFQLEPSDSWFDFALNFFRIRSHECKDVVACRLGSAMAKEYPTISSLILSLSSSFIHLADNTTQILYNSMNNVKQGNLRDVCQQLLNMCPAIESFETYWFKNTDALARRMAKILNNPVTLSTLIEETTTAATASGVLSTNTSQNVVQNLALHILRNLMS